MEMNNCLQVPQWLNYILSPTNGDARTKRKNSRGKALRKKYEVELKQQVHKLRELIDTLQTSYVLDDNQLLQTPFSETGSVTKMICEYFHLFRFGLYNRASLLSTKTMKMAPNAVLNKVDQQEKFLYSIMDEDVMICDRRGPTASIEQWRYYTSAHDVNWLELQRIETIYVKDDAIIIVHTNCHFRVTRKTFWYLFPGALQNQELMNKFLHRDVVYRVSFRFQFTKDGKIASESFESDIVQGLLDAGCSLKDIGTLMQFYVVSFTRAISSNELAVKE